MGRWVCAEPYWSQIGLEGGDASRTWAYDTAGAVALPKKFRGLEEKSSGVSSVDPLEGLDGLRSCPSGFEDGGDLRGERGAVFE